MSVGQRRYAKQRCKTRRKTRARHSRFISKGSDAPLPGWVPVNGRQRRGYLRVPQSAKPSAMSFGLLLQPFRKRRCRDFYGY